MREIILSCEQEVNMKRIKSVKQQLLGLSLALSSLGTTVGVSTSAQATPHAFVTVRAAGARLPSIYNLIGVLVAKGGKDFMPEYVVLKGEIAIAGANLASNSLADTALRHTRDLEKLIKDAIAAI